MNISIISLLLWISSVCMVAAILWYLLACNNHLDNIIKGKTYKQLLLLGTVVVFTLSYVYLWANLLIKDHSGTVLLDIYSWFSQTSGVGNVSDPFSLKIFSLIVSLTGSVVFSGLLISTFNNLIQRRITAVEEGKIRYRSLSGHDILIGANELTFSVVQFLLSNTKKDSVSRIVILSKHPAPANDRVEATCGLFAHRSYRRPESLGNRKSKYPLPSVKDQKGYQTL